MCYSIIPSKKAYTWAIQNPLTMQNITLTLENSFISVPNIISTSNPQNQLLLLAYFHHGLVLLLLWLQINGLMQYVLFCVRLLSLSMLFLWLIHPYFVMYFMPFYCWEVFHCMNVPPFVYLSSNWGISSLFPHFSYYE